MRYLPALVLDAVLVLVFAVIGRASHDEDPLGFLLTAWPFLVALLLGHLVAALLPARPRRPWSPAWGAVVWLVTVIGGLILRVFAGDTAQVPFIIVATLVLGLFLVGWRLVAALVRRRGAREREAIRGGSGPVAPNGSEPVGSRAAGSGAEPAGAEPAGATLSAAELAESERSDTELAESEPAESEPSAAEADDADDREPDGRSTV